MKIKIKHNIFTIILSIFFYFYSYACEEGVLEIPKRKIINVKVDGLITSGEYPVTYKNPNKGIEISWVHDDSLIFVALKSNHRGWIGISFGSTDIKNAEMILFSCAHNNVYFEEQKWFYRFFKVHHIKNQNRIVKKAAGRETYDGTVIEFSVRFTSDKQKFKPYYNYRFLTAWHKRSKDFREKPTDYSTAQFCICTAEDESEHKRR